MINYYCYPLLPGLFPCKLGTKLSVPMVSSKKPLGCGGGGGGGGRNLHIKMTEVIVVQKSKMITFTPCQGLQGFKQKDVTGTICQSTNLVPRRGEYEFKPQQQNEILVPLGSTVDYKNKRRNGTTFRCHLGTIIK